MSWKEITNKETKAESLTKDFKFKDFINAWAFMNKVALLAEKMDHHPDWSNSYNKVNISLSTHSAGNKITSKDRRLADQIDDKHMRKFFYELLFWRLSLPKLELR